MNMFLRIMTDEVTGDEYFEHFFITRVDTEFLGMRIRKKQL